ncbi:hypothetical protein Osc7112_4286 [Oscillatoria nigro-viridis PCC 7112]|uniref:Uncharacterized protein n=2 Tax=Phormidium nigroviride TaxID=482564 RepID=K9VMA5_9CYAN|nr:hypothetical protein Osc7112_4286 [Oscillatoria nigro-viridis PCC 7112]
MQIIVHIRGGFSPVMSSVLAVVKNFRLGIILALACLACILSYVPAVSQTSPTQLPNTLKLGVRTSVYPIGNKINVNFFTQFLPENNFVRLFYENKIHKPNSAEGFCGTFGKELQKELASNGQQIKVIYIPIVNQHKGVVAPRYDGLKRRIIDIECGPNSISSGELPTGQGIKFSEPFYETGVKILLKEELAEELNSGARGLNKITISVVKESTTLKVLQSIKDINQSKIATSDSGAEGLTDLKDNTVQAFASDALIVGSILREGVKGERSDQPWWNIFNRRVDQQGQPFRQPYENLGYTIYPNNSSKKTYVTGNEPTEKYAMAVLEKTPFRDDLLNAINKTLDKSKLSSAGQKLKEYETRASDLSWNGWKKLLLFINTYIWVVFVPVIWALFIQFLSQILHESWVTTFTWVSGITVCLSLGLIVIIQILLIVVPLLFPGY